MKRDAACKEELNNTAFADNGIEAGGIEVLIHSRLVGSNSHEMFRAVELMTIFQMPFDVTCGTESIFLGAWSVTHTTLPLPDPFFDDLVAKVPDPQLRAGTSCSG